MAMGNVDTYLLFAIIISHLRLPSAKNTPHLFPPADLGRTRSSPPPSQPTPSQTENAESLLHYTVTLFIHPTHYSQHTQPLSHPIMSILLASAARVARRSPAVQQQVRGIHFENVVGKVSLSSHALDIPPSLSPPVPLSPLFNRLFPSSGSRGRLDCS
jgi:hypothetical protein